MTTTARRPLSRKFLMLYIAVFSVMAVTIVWLQYVNTHRLMHDAGDSEVSAIVDAFTNMLVEEPELVGSERLNRAITRFEREIPDIQGVWVADSHLLVVNHLDRRRIGKPLDISVADVAVLRSGDPVVRLVRRDGRLYLERYRPVPLPAASRSLTGIAAVVGSHMDLTRLDRRLWLASAEQALWLLLIQLPVLLVLYVMTRRSVIAPIVQLTSAAQRFAATGEATRIEQRSGDELEVLADVFSSMTTERARSETALRAATEVANAASRSKSEFLANMSHEIRTPMNGVLGMLELALATDLSREQRDYVLTAQRSAEALLGVINDILDFSKIEAGRLELERIRFGLRDSISDLLAPMALRAHEKKLELTLQVEPEVPDALIGDVHRLRQVLINLIGNAIKFTDSGEVVVRVAVQRHDEGAVVLHLTVSDTGIGIPQDKLKQIFEAFVQADTSTTREYGGTGLGLSIVARLVHALGGEIWVNSLLGRGSDFNFTARFEIDSAGGFGVADLAALEGLPVLVVDDNATNRLILEQILKNWRMRPTLVASGPEALSAIRSERQPGMQFKLVLLDAQMPGMDGFEVAERLRQEAELRGAAIMMLSSLAGSGEFERCRKVGVNHYLVKPVRQSQLLDSILTTIAGAPLRLAKPEHAESTEITRVDQPLRILLAEDNLVNQKLATTLLRKRGHDVTVVDNGRAAVAEVERHHFDVVLMDLQMPILGGLEATAEIRAQEETTGKHVTIIAMTARAMEGDRERCIAAGMDGYIAKPIRANDLFRTIEGRIVDEALAGGESAEALDRPVLNIPSLLRLIAGDMQLLAELVKLFDDDSERLLREIEVGLEAEDAEAVQFAAHTLKGAAANLQGERVRTLANNIEQSAREHELSDAGQNVAALRDELTALRQALHVLMARGGDVAEGADG